MIGEVVTIVGAGLSGAVLARELAEAGYKIDVFEARDHVAGNCYTERDADTGVMVHRYGPHIFHTDDATVWNYIQRFGKFRPYVHRVWTKARGGVFAMPISLATINQFFGATMGPAQARAYIESLSEKVLVPKTFEEQALSMMGRDIYEAFFEGYTQKQWGCPPSDLPASILRRLPMRFSYADSYFSHRFQGMPEDGYTSIVQAMLDHPNISLTLSHTYQAGRARQEHLFWTGPLDAYFDFVGGRLGYRTLDFDEEKHAGDYQGCAVMNFADADVPYTRITEHKHFAPWEKHEGTVVTRETPRASGPQDVPLYPIRLAKEKTMLGTYVEMAKSTQAVTFLGRLGTYRYLDMDVCVREALEVARGFIAKGPRLGAFMHPPM